LEYWSINCYTVRILFIEEIDRFFLNLFSLSGFSPFAGENIEETIQNVNFVRWDTREFYDDVTQEAVIFVQQCLKKSPK
jgi:hypothetical protein